MKRGATDRARYRSNGSGVTADDAFNGAWAGGIRLLPNDWVTADGHLYGACSRVEMNALPRRLVYRHMDALCAVVELLRYP